MRIRGSGYRDVGWYSVCEEAEGWGYDFQAVAEDLG